MKYSPDAIAQWIFTYQADAIQSKNEIRFACPQCGHPSHYFNIDKGIGFCHRASCHTRTNIFTLRDIWGTLPDEIVVLPTPKIRLFKNLEIQIPQSCQPLITLEQGKLVSLFPDIVEHLREDRYLSLKDIHKWSIMLDLEKERIVVPVFENNKLVNYVSRAAWWFQGKTNYQRYDYPSGVSITDYFLGWDEAQTWEHMMLVENTFNAIWLRDYNCSTNFGSHISDMQLQKLYRSKIKTITLMWDYGAEEKAEEAVRKFGSIGIRSDFVRFPEDKPQPDNNSLNDILQNDITMKERLEAR